MALGCAGTKTVLVVRDGFYTYFIFLISYLSNADSTVQKLLGLPEKRMGFDITRRVSTLQRTVCFTKERGQS